MAGTREECSARQDEIDGPDSEDDGESMCEEQNKVCFCKLCLMADFLRYLHSVNVWFSAFSCCYFHKWSQNLIDIIHRMIFQGFKFHKPIVSTKFVEFKYLKKTIYGSEHGVHML